MRLVSCHKSYISYSPTWEKWRRSYVYIRCMILCDWRNETARSSISHGLVWKINPNLSIWGIKSELKGIMVNKGRIHRELRYFRDIFWNLVKLDNELRWEIRENGIFRKITQRSIRGIKNRSIWISNHGEIKDGSGRKFSESRRTQIEIKMKLNLNWNPKPKIDDTWR